MNKAIAETTKRTPTRPSSTLSLIDDPAKPNAKASNMTGADRTTKLKKVINMITMTQKPCRKRAFMSLLEGEGKETVFTTLHGNMSKGE